MSCKGCHQLRGAQIVHALIRCTQQCCADIGPLCGTRPRHALPPQQPNPSPHTPISPQMRTTWRDLTEHHCPRFGRHRTVALPVFAPKGVEGEVTDYRIQLSFDGEPPTGGVQPAPAGSCLARTWWRAKRLQPPLLQPD